MSDMNINQVGEYGDLTKTEAERLALVTESRLKNKTVDDIIKLDIRTIEAAYQLIQSDKVQSIELKTLINNLLDMIVNLTTTSRELFNWRSKSSLINVWGSGEDTIDITNKHDFASQIEEIQNKLTTKYPELMSSNNGNSKIQEETVKKLIRNIITDSGIILEGCSSVDESIKVAIDEIRGYSVLTPLMDQPKDVAFEDFVEEIRVDDYNDIRIVRGGREVRTKLSFRSPEHALLFANKLNRSSEQPGEFSKAKPFLRIRIGATTRVSMMRDPIATRDAELVEGLGRPVVHLCIRRQRSDPFTSEQLIKLNSINKYGDMLLKTLLKSGVSICFYGGTGTGKTSMFNAYIGDISSGERMITMAEVDEMKARRIDYRKTVIDEDTGREIENPLYRKAINSVLMWESTDMNREIGNGRGFQGMFNAALTMTPYTIMIQESKGAEAKDLVEAAISDHQVLTTVHAKDEKTLINRLYKMLQQGGDTTSEEIIFKDIVTAFPVVVGCSRFKDGSRKIASIVEYRGYITTTKEIVTNTLYKFKVTSNRYEDGKLKVIGDFKNYALPSRTLKESMELKGMLASDWTELENEYKINKANKPVSMDKTIYEGKLFEEEEY